MFGTIIGDYIGSRFQYNPIYNKYFDLFDKECFFTDISILTASVAQSFLYKESVFQNLKKFTENNWSVGYEKNHTQWIENINSSVIIKSNNYNYNNEQDMFYSCVDNNLCLARNSPVILLAKSLEEVKHNTFLHTNITHREKNSLYYNDLLAQIVYNLLIFIKKENLFDNGNYEKNIKLKKDYFFNLIENNKIYFDSLNSYCMVGTHNDCYSTLTRVLACIYEADNFEEVMRNCIFIGGDCKANASIAGFIAEIIYSIPPTSLKDFISYAQYNGKRYQQVAHIISATYLYSSFKDLFLIDYLPVIEYILINNNKK